MENDGPGFSVDAAIERLNEISLMKHASPASLRKCQEETRRLQNAISRAVRPYLAESNFSVDEAVDVLANAIKIAVQKGYLIGEAEDVSGVGEEIWSAIRPYLR
jgi:hypothetical protein